MSPRVTLGRQGGILVRNWLAQAGSQLLTIPLSLAFVMYVARRLGPEEYGVYQLAVSFPSLLAIAVPLGMNVYFSRDLAQHPSEARRYASYGFGLALASATVIYVVLQLVAVSVGLPDQARVAIAISGLAAVASSIALLSGAILRAFERMQLDALLGLGERVTATVAGLAVAYAWGSALALVCVLLFTSAAKCLVSLGLVRGQVGSFRVRVSRDQSWAFIRTGWPFLIGGYGDTFYNFVGPTVLAKVSTTLEVGTYAAAWRLILLLTVFALSFANVTLPLLARSAVEGRDRMRAILRGMLPLLVFASGACASLVALLAQPISWLVYGDRFVGTPLVLILLAFMLPATFVKYFLGNSLMSINEQPYITKLLILVACLSVGLTALASTHYGAAGAAVALVGCEYCVSIGMLVRLALLGVSERPLVIAAAWLAGVGPGAAALVLPLPALAQVLLACLGFSLIGVCARGRAQRGLSLVRAHASS